MLASNKFFPNSLMYIMNRRGLIPNPVAHIYKFRTQTIIFNTLISLISFVNQETT